MACSWIAGLVIPFILGQLFVTEARGLHRIDMRYPQLFPTRFDWDKFNQHFIIGSSHLGTLQTVSDAGVVADFVTDKDYAGQGSIKGIQIDLPRNRVLALIHNPATATSALAAYDVKTAERLLYVELDQIQDSSGDRILASDVSVDPYGNSFVTDSSGNIILRVSADGIPAVFSRSQVFNSEGATANNALVQDSGLSGIAYHPKGDLLVTQCNTGLLFKVRIDDGVARVVQTSKPLIGANGIAVRKDGSVVVSSYHTAWYLKSPDNWGIASIVDEIPLNASMFPSDITIREGGRSYILNSFYQGTANEVNVEDFSIQEIEFPKDVAGEKVWVIGLLICGLLYFYFWRFQMGNLVRTINKKRN